MRGSNVGRNDSEEEDVMNFVVDTRGDAALGGVVAGDGKRAVTREEEQLERALFGKVRVLRRVRSVGIDFGWLLFMFCFFFVFFSFFSLQGILGDHEGVSDDVNNEEVEGEDVGWVSKLVFEEEGPSKRARKESVVVWHDSDDDEVNLKRVVGGRKLRTQPEEHIVPAPEYETRLRQQYESVVPAPKWAQVKARSGDNDDEALFATTAPLTLSGKLSAQEPLRVKRLGDVNVDDVSNCTVVSAQFHHSSQIALTAGRDRTLRLFQVSEKRCTKLHSAFFLDMPILSSFFIPHSNEVMCLGPKKLFYVYDMEGDAFVRVPHLMGHHEKSWVRAVPSPDGQLSAFLGGETGNVALLDNRSRIVTQTLRMSGPVEHATFSPDSSFLWTAGSESQVFKWDMRMTGRRCVTRFSDFGGVGVCSMSNSPCGRWQAVGDKSGMVNVYDLFNAQDDERKPMPAKTFKQLVTSVSRVTWNHDGQLLCASSIVKPDALRVFHLPSFKVVENWPQQVKPSPLGHVSDTCFSPHSGYLTVGNSAGNALLYRMLSFDAY